MLVDVESLKVAAVQICLLPCWVASHSCFAVHGPDIIQPDPSQRLSNHISKGNLRVAQSDTQQDVHIEGDAADFADIDQVLDKFIAKMNLNGLNVESKLFPNLDLQVMDGGLPIDEDGIEELLCLPQLSAGSIL